VAEQVTVLEARGISKQFPGVQALRDVSLRVGRGEVLALLGENGAGKSTLMKILAGVQPPDTGTLCVDGKPVRFSGVRDALDCGIALIHQELNLAGNLDIAANIFLGREPGRVGFLDRKRMEAESEQYLRRVGLQLSPRTLVDQLPIGRQQLVEIAKALSVNARVLIMDEPTSSLSQGETQTLFRVVKELRDSGVSIIYISHRLGEVKELADRVEVLRDGCNAGSLDRDSITHDAMVRLMVGRDVVVERRPPAERKGSPVLKVQGLVSPAYPAHAASFALYAGEILGIAGLVGAGRTELLQTIFGVTPALGGVMHVDGTPYAPRQPQDAIRAGIALAPEDRKQQGLLLQMCIRENVSLPTLRRDQRKGLINLPAEAALAREAIAQFNIATPSAEQHVNTLSGGNQQKVVLGKWLATKPRVLLLDEPTRGIDIGAKQEIYALVRKLAAEGLAVLFVSSEMEEILTLPDRVLVMREGAITGELQQAELSEEAVMHLATAPVAALA
jgi:ribose transport system ATP-binding protein